MANKPKHNCKKIVALSITTQPTYIVSMGGSVQIVVTADPTNATLNLTYSRSDTTVINIDSNGLVTPKKAGTCTVTINDIVSGKRTSTVVTVTA